MSIGEWLAWGALLPMVVLNVRRWRLLRSLRRQRADWKTEAIEAFGAGFRHQHKRRAMDIAAVDRRIDRAEKAPIWKWTP